MTDICPPFRRSLAGCAAMIFVFTAVACCAQDRIVTNTECEEGDSGVVVLDSSGHELLRFCQQGWPYEARFVHLTGSKDPDLFRATAAGAKVEVAVVYRKQDHHYIRVGEFGGFMVSAIDIHDKPVVAVKPDQYGSGSLTQLYSWDGSAFRRCDESFPEFFEPEIREQRQVLDVSGLPAGVFADACQLGATGLLYARKYDEAEALCKKALQVVNTPSRLVPNEIGGSFKQLSEDQSAAERLINQYLSAIYRAKQRRATTDSGLNNP